MYMELTFISKFFLIRIKQYKYYNNRTASEQSHTNKNFR